MLLFFSVFLISQISAIYCDVDEQNKFIDQLQDPDKEEFLERIARRISGDVDLKLPVNDSVYGTRISDAELDKHSDYVKKVIDEEKGKFEKLDRRSFNFSHIDFTVHKKRRRKRNVNSDGDKNTEANTEPSATITVQTVYGSSKELDVEKRDIQVKGFRPKSRRSTNSTSNFNSSNEKNLLSDKIEDKNEGVSLVTEDSENKKVTVNSGLENYNTNTLITTTESEKSNEKISPDLKSLNVENKTLRHETKQSDLERDVKSSHEDNTKYSEKVNLEPKLAETVSTNRKAEELTLISNTNSTVELKDNGEKKDKKAENLNLNKNKDLTVELDDTDKNNNKLGDLTLNSIKNLTVTLKENIEEKNNKKPEELTLDSQINLTATLKDNNTVKENKQAEVPSLNSNKNFTVEVKDNVEKKALRTESRQSDYLDKVSDKKTELNIPKVSTVHVSFDAVNNTNSEVTKLQQKKNEADAKNNKSDVNDEVKTLQIAQDVVKALRIGIDRDMMKNRNKNVRTKFGRNNVNVYGLYENSEENSHEIHNYHHEKSNPHETYNNNHEEPYYVPVYNYFADNAYYNAYNKYGPNQEDSKVLKSNSKFVPLYSRDQFDVSKEKLDRTFYKTPQHGKPQRNNHKAKVRNTVFPILPPVIDSKPHNLPQYDYDYLFGKNDEFLDHALRERKLKDSISKDPYLKNRIRDIRLALYKYNKEKEDNEKRAKGKVYNGWLDKSVEYYTHRTKTKSLNTLKNYLQNIDYDYLGVGSRDLKTEHLSSNKLLPADKDNKAKSILNDIIQKESMELKNEDEEINPFLKKLVKVVEFDKDEEVEACIRVMGDLIQTDNEGLEHYDWLESTVNVQSAIEKLTELTVAAISRETLHPSDMELLKYAAYLHSLSVSAKEEHSERKSLLPKPKKRKVNNNLKTGYKERVWLYRIPDPGLGYDFDYEGLQNFLDDLADNLYDLHDAIKHIALITTLKNQHWFRNIKDLYLRKPTRKQLLELVLHLGTTRLFNLIEDSSKKGIEKNFLKYIHENQLEVSGIQEAFVFVLKVLDSAMDNKLRMIKVDYGEI